MMEPWLVLLFLLAPEVSQAMELPAALTGTVTDPDGRPVEGVPLWAVTSPEQVGADLPPSAVSGPDGSFSIPGLRPGRIELHACGQRHVHTSRLVWYLDEPVHLEVAPGVTLRGRVLGPEGTPEGTVAGFRVFARELPWIPLEFGEHVEPDPWTPCPDAVWATSGEDGGFEIGPLAPGRYNLEASYFSMLASGLAQEAPIPLQLTEAGEVDGIEIRLENNGSHAGSLTDSTGAPIQMGWVNVSTGDGESRSYLTESDGSFRYFADPGEVTFRVETKGYKAHERIVEISAGAPPVDLVVERDESWKTVRGRVAGPEGDPVEGAWVYFLGSGPETQSAADGSFELQVLLEYSLTLHVSKEGFATGWLDVDLDAPPVVEGVIRLEPGAVVAGRVLGLTPGDRGSDTRLVLRRSEGPDLDTTLRPDGTFRFERVPAGAWKLTFKSGHRSVMKRVIVEPGPAELTVDLSLPPRVLVSGRVLDDQGRPVAEAEVFASQGGETVALGGTRADGRFELHVPEGAVRITASHWEYQSGRVEVPAGRRARDLVIRLEPETVLVSGRLVGFAPGESPEILAILEEPTRRIQSFGRVEVDQYKLSLQPGAWTIQAILYDDAGEPRKVVRWPLEVEHRVAEMFVELDAAYGVAEP